MRTGFISLILVLTASALPGFAGDASGFDPTAIDQCMAEGGECADAGMQACRDYAEQEYTGDDPDFVEKHCLDAAHQAWEAKLAETYKALLASEVEVEKKLRQTEQSWIKFRDDLCDYAKSSASARDENPEIAQLTCQRDEASRHWKLLNARQEALTK